MKRMVPVALVLVSCGGATPSDGEFETPEGYQSRSGKEVYQQHCAMCHGADGSQGTGGAADLRASKMDSTAVVDLLKNGRNGMPKQMHQFKSEEEVSNVIDYVKSLRK